MHASPLTFDDAALRASVDAARARAEGSALTRSEGGRVGEAAGTGWVIVQSAVLVLGLGVLAALAVGVVQAIFGGSGVNLATVVLAAAIVLPFAIIRITGVRRSRRETDASWFRLTRFAAANGMSFRLIERDPTGPFALFGIGRRRVATDIVSRPGPLGPVVASYAFDTYAGRTRMPHALTLVRFGLRTPLPAFVLVTKKRDLPGRAWGDAPGWHTLRIGDDVDVRFEVRCAPNDDAAVRALLTPALRHALTVAEDTDVEVAGAEVCVITRRAVPTADPAFWEWVADLDAVMRAHLDVPEAGQGGSAPAADVAEEAARERRRALFAPVPVARTAAVGCLVPLVLGLTAAAVLGALGVGV